MLIKKNKRGQVTLFIIIAIVIVAVIVLAFLFWPGIKGFVTEIEPRSYIIECMNQPIQNSLDVLSKRGGTLSPENYFMFRGEKIEYLCYTNEYYKTCVMQQPLLKQHIESQLADSLRPQARQCLLSLKQELESKGGSVSSKTGDLNVEITNDKIIFNIDADMIVSKNGESSQTFKNFKIDYSSKFYDLIMLSLTILNWEARYGDSDILSFMLSYPDLQVQKIKQSDGTKIYIIKNRDSLEEFTFATRSLSWPGGFKLKERVK